MFVHDAAVFLIRLGLVALFFPASALDKIFNFQAAVSQAATISASRVMAVGMIFVGIAIEILMPVAILTGICDRLAALVLSIYCVATALLFKQFWRSGAFWKSGSSRGRDLFWDFLKNVAVASGFLLITAGVDGAGIGPFCVDPLVSSHPYIWSLRHGG